MQLVERSSTSTTTHLVQDRTKRHEERCDAHAMGGKSCDSTVLHAHADSAAVWRSGVYCCGFRGTVNIVTVRCCTHCVSDVLVEMNVRRGEFEKLYVVCCAACVLYSVVDHSTPQMVADAECNARGRERYLQQ